MAGSPNMPKLRKRSEQIALDQLTPKQRSFAELVANGHSYAAAYRLSYDTSGTPRTIYVEASRVANDPKISNAIARLRDTRENSDRMSNWSIERLLCTSHAGHSPRTRLKAMSKLARMIRMI